MDWESTKDYLNSTEGLSWGEGAWDQLPQVFLLEERERRHGRQEGSSKWTDHAYWFALERGVLLILEAEMTMGEKDSHVKEYIFHIYIFHIHPG